MSDYSFTTVYRRAFVFVFIFLPARSFLTYFYYCILYIVQFQILAPPRASLLPLSPPALSCLALSDSSHRQTARAQFPSQNPSRSAWLASLHEATVAAVPARPARTALLPVGRRSGTAYKKERELCTTGQISQSSTLFAALLSDAMAFLPYAPISLGAN